MSTKDKSKGRRYTASERSRALQLYREYGPSVAAKRLGIPYETIRRWAKNAGEIVSSPRTEVAHAHAAAAIRTSTKWADVRETEADQAGEAARLARERILDVLVTDDHQMLRAAVNAYEILINKAEMLSGQATERIAIWAEQDIDRELRELVKEIEASKRALPTPRIDEDGTIEIEEVVTIEETIEVIDIEVLMDDTDEP